MHNYEMVRLKTNNLILEMNQYINCLYVIPCPFTRNLVLNMLRQKMSFLHFLMNFQPNQLPEKTFTIEDLTRFNGRNGRPAYIAVNGVIYDVTNSAAWAAATHFGLSAGRDLTEEFENCHAGQQQILNTIPVVGRLL